ncbi:hypothetical protein GGP86_002491 [Salinibacter ruber]|jgi:hypothetical protein|uniref:hypothetical protein n=1 Tax=Salinibacter ruber TaxID=146919 RepID=UPI002167A8B4|nr:hypothetical protein [Salinibacter ruber]MCS3862704.1 hypothetical protein [Salinibacter ruber]
MQSAQEETLGSTDSKPNLNQNLYMYSIMSGVISAALLYIPVGMLNAIGSFVALVSIGFLLAIPYNLLGQIGD